MKGPDHTSQPRRTRFTFGLATAARTWTWLLATLAGAAVTGCVQYRAAPISPPRSAASFDERSLTNEALQRFLVAQNIAPASRGASGEHQWDFTGLTWAAFYYQPALDVARAQWEVARAGIKTAGARPNPTLTASPGYNFTSANGVSPWIPTVTLDVPIETAGKRGHRLARANQLAEAARWNIATTAWQIRSGVRTALLEHSVARERFELLTRQDAIQTQLTTLLEQRLAAGAADASEVSVSRLARQRAQVELGAARRQAATARARLADALGVPSRALEGVSLRPSLELSSEQEQVNLPTARRLALQGRADIVSALADYAAAESALHLEVARQYPDVRLSPSYQWDQGENKWSFGVSVELPLFNRNQGPIAESLARRTEAGARFTALQARIIGEVDLALTNRALAADELAQTRRLLAAQEESERLAAARFQAGAADTLEIQAAEIETAAVRLTLLDVRVRAAQAASQLEDALQRPLPGWNSLEQSPRATAANSPNNSHE